MFFLCIVRARKHKFAAKKTQGKNCAMQRHEQVFSPAAASRKSMQGNRTSGLDARPMGRGGRYWTKLAGERTSRFRASFLKAQ
jgi:hypothetical protein